jgi:hypothetical protein
MSRIHELYVLYSSPNFMQVMKSRQKWARHTAHTGMRSGAYSILVGNPTTVQIQRIILKWICEKWA